MVKQITKRTHRIDVTIAILNKICFASSLLWSIDLILLTSETIAIPESYVYGILEKYEIEKPIQNQSLINVDVIRYYDNLQNLSKLVSCLKSLFRHHLLRLERVPVLLSDTSEFDENIGIILEGLQSEMVTYVISGNFSMQENYNRTNSALIICRSMTDFELSLHLSCFCGPRCRFVVTLTSLYESEEKFLEDSSTIVRLLWDQWIVKAVIVALVHDRILIAGSLAFQSNVPREPSDPMLLGQCSNGRLNGTRKIFAPYYLNDCIVNVCYFENEPYVYAEKNESTNQIQGIEGNLMETLATSLKAKLDRVEIPRDNGTNLFEKLKYIVIHSPENDLVFSGLHWSIESEIEYTTPYDIQQIVWLVPLKPYVSFLGLVMPFHYKVWFAIGILLLFTISLRILFVRGISFIDVFSLILGVALPRQPRAASSRIQFFSWALFGYVLTQSYLASMAGQLMNNSNQQIDTMKELVASGLILGGTSRYRDLFKEDQEEISSGIYDKFVIFETMDYMRVLEDLLTGRNTSIALIYELKLSADESNWGQQHAHVLRETLARYPLALAVWKGLPYLDEINLKLTMLNEGGFTGFWCRWVSRNHSSYKRRYPEPSNLELDQLSPSFLLLVLGHSVGVFTFLVEVGAFPFKYLRPPLRAIFHEC